MSDIPQKEKKQQRSVQNCTVLHALATCSYFSVCSEFFYLTCSGTGALGLTMWAPQPSCTLLPSRQLAGGFPLNRCSAQPLLRSTVAPLSVSPPPELGSATLYYLLQHHRSPFSSLYYTVSTVFVLYSPHLYCINCRSPFSSSLHFVLSLLFVL